MSDQLQWNCTFRFFLPCSRQARMPHSKCHGYTLPIPFIDFALDQCAPVRRIAGLHQTVRIDCRWIECGRMKSIFIARARRWQCIECTVHTWLDWLQPMYNVNLKFNFGIRTANCWQNDCRQKKSLIHRKHMQSWRTVAHSVRRTQMHLMLMDVRVVAKTATHSHTWLAWASA